MEKQLILENIFAELKEKQVYPYKSSDIQSILNELNNKWKDINKQTLFQGDYEIFVKDDIIVLFDNVNKIIYFIKDNEREVVKVLRKLENYIFEKLPEIITTDKNHVEIDFNEYKFHVNVYEKEIGVSKIEVNRFIKRFIYNNYVLKKDDERTNRF